MLMNWHEQAAPDFTTEDVLPVLCIGSTEQHALHMPVGTDALLASSVVRAAAEKAKSKILLLPVQYVGYSPHHRFAKGYLTLSQETMFHYYLEVCRCVFESGFKKLLIVNGHGGNQSCLQTVVNELAAQYDYRAVLLRYWDPVGKEIRAIRESVSGGMGHAGEFETSVMQYVRPELVHNERIKEYPPARIDRYYDPDLQAGNPIWQYKTFDTYSPDGNIGQPHLASPEKGEKFFSTAVNGLTALMDCYMDHGL